MIYTIDQIKSLIAPVAEKHGLKAVYLFGSYARGAATEQSDVDLLVDTTGTNLKSLFSLGAFYYDMEQALKKKLDVITLSTLEQESQMPSEVDFKDIVWKEKVPIYTTT